MVVALVPPGLPASAASPDIVVSQLYGGGGNTGATLTNDFIELYNRGTSAVNVTGWSVQYASAAGTSWQVTRLSGWIVPGRYYLIQEAAGAGGTTSLPRPHATGSIAMSATSAKVALVNNATALTGSGCPFAAAVVDFVGYGTANCSETAAAAVLTNTTAAIRNGGGAQDTDNNSADFTVGTPTPRATADYEPTVASTSPANGASGVAVDANVSITFSEAVSVSGAWYGITCSASGPQSAVASGGPTTYSLDPTVDFAVGETCTVTVTAALVTDADADDPPNTMPSDFSSSFSVATPTSVARIHEIQGAAHTSPLNGQLVGDVPGIVTAKLSNGFYLQDPSPDADDATSEAIFVFTRVAPTSISVGDAVTVNASVSEFRPGGSSSTNLTTTELVSPSITVISSGNALPAPTIIGTGGRVPPSMVIEDDASGSVETSGVFDPASDGIDFYESLEAMRVQVNNALAVGPTNAFGEIPVVGDNSANAGIVTVRDGVVISADDFNPERIQLDDTILPTPVVNVGDGFTTSVVGVMDYSFGNFKLYITSALTRVDRGLARETTRSPLDQELVVGTYNVENLDPTDGTFARHAALIVKNLRSPDLLAIEEIQDDDGAANTATTDASLSWTMLIAAIQAAGGPIYDYRQIDPVDDQDGGEPGGNIRVGFLFRTDRGLEFIDRPGGDSTTPVTVVEHPSGPRLSVSPGRVEPNNAAFNASRKPLAGEFRANGRKLFVIANHFSSKGGDQPLFGRFQPPARSSEVARHAQAQIVNDFVDQILAADPNANVIVLGDINDFEFSQTVDILEGGVLTSLMDTLPKPERYSYVFEGNSQVLDQILVSGNLLNNFSVEYDPVHVNSEFADQASDHDPQVARLDFRGRPTPKEPK
jgi:hypothetical protein